jgi:hypothetical protein
MGIKKIRTRNGVRAGDWSQSLTGLAPTREINHRSHGTTLVLKSLTLLLHYTSEYIYTCVTTVGLERVVLNCVWADWRTNWTGRLNWANWLRDWLIELCLNWPHHPPRTLYILADDVILPGPSLSGSFLKIPHSSTHWDCSGSFFCRLGGVNDNQTTQAVVEWSRVKVALSTFLATSS